MFIEYRGEFVKGIQSNDTNIELVWLIAKNKHVPNVEHLVKMAITAKQYQCYYDSSKTQQLKDLGLD